MSDETLVCPECGGPEFAVGVEAWQERARFEKHESGTVLIEAQAVHVEHWDEDDLFCQGCGESLVTCELIQRADYRSVEA